MKKNNSKNYAGTLFQLSVESHETEKIGDALKMLNPLCDKEVMDFFSNPFVDEGTKLKIVKDVFPAMPEIMYDFFSRLIKKNEIKILPEVIKKYNKLVLDFHNIVEAKVISVEKIDEPSLSKIRTLLEKLTDKNIVLSESIDKSLIGGIKIETDNFVVDGTIRGKFGLIGKELLK